VSRHPPQIIVGGMDDEQIDEFDLSLVKMTDSEITRELYRCLSILLESERVIPTSHIMNGPN
jgi:hypothetical protein